MVGFFQVFFGLFSQRPNIPAVPGPLFGGNAAPGPFLDYDLRDAAVVDADEDPLLILKVKKRPKLVVTSSGRC